MDTGQVVAIVIVLAVIIGFSLLSSGVDDDNKMSEEIWDKFEEGKINLETTSRLYQRIGRK